MTLAGLRPVSVPAGQGHHGIRGCESELCIPSCPKYLNLPIWRIFASGQWKPINRHRQMVRERTGPYFRAGKYIPDNRSKHRWKAAAYCRLAARMVRRTPGCEMRHRRFGRFRPQTLEVCRDLQPSGLHFSMRRRSGMNLAFSYPDIMYSTYPSRVLICKYQPPA